jgi:amidohydrolase
VSNIKQQVQLLAEQHYAATVSDREHLHMHPELSFEEKATSAYIKGRLDELGITYTSGWAGHGIVAVIDGDLPGSCVGLRADIDALPITELNDTTYKSQNEGVMHACGHDVHTASLLGVARILSSMRSSLKGRVVLIWQPGEEKLPGGASIMIKEGLLEQYKPVYILGQHVHPPLETGTVGIKGGPYMASADEIYIQVNGKGGHAALPHKTVDPIIIMARLLTSLQDVVSRKAPPTKPSVLSFGKIWSHGGATNVIPDAVSVEGTFRAMDEDWRQAAHAHIEQICKHIAAAYGATADVDIRKGYPYLHNHEALTASVQRHITDYLGADQVIDLPIRMTAEDFSYYSQHADCCFYRLGTGNKAQGIVSPVHTPTFDVDPQSLKTGIGTMAYLAIELLDGLS